MGIEEKLRGYSLALGHERGRAKANGFAIMLGIEPESVDYLELQIREGISSTPISAVRSGASGGVICTVQFQIAGHGRYSHRTASLRTAWVLATSTAPPRLITAFLRGREHR
jgi:hypothetical protein